jgi:hypothetical protein
MMFWILCGEFPFKGRNKMELARKVFSEQPNLEGGVWDQITADAKDCLRYAGISNKTLLGWSQATTTTTTTTRHMCSFQSMKQNLMV